MAPIAAVMLFLGENEIDEADTAAREAAEDLGRRMRRPVLLLDLTLREGALHAQFAAAGALVPRPPPAASPAGQAVLAFHQVRGGTLWVSTVAPGAVVADEAFWRRMAAEFPSLRRRLLDLFGAVVVAVPSMMRSPRALGFASQADATILVAREGHDVAGRLQRLRHRLAQVGGTPVGVVMTGCTSHMPPAAVRP